MFFCGGFLVKGQVQPLISALDFSYSMKASQRLSKNVLIFIFLLVLVTYIFIENRYKCFFLKKGKKNFTSIRLEFNVFKMINDCNLK